MQYSTIYYLKKAAATRTFNNVIKAGILAFIIYFIWLKFQQQQISMHNFAESFLVLRAKPVWVLMVPLVMVFCNWGLEAQKWQILCQRINKVSLYQSFQAVLCGLTLGFITPRSIGDYAGRILYVQAEEREKLVGAVLLNRIAQSFSTFVFGILGLVFLVQNKFLTDFQSIFYILIGFCCLLGILCLLAYRRSLISRYLKNYLKPQILKYIEIIEDYSVREVWQVFLLSALRYFVFCLQFILLLLLLEVELPFYQLYAGVSGMFLLKSIIPTFNFLSDLGVREFSAMYMFSAFSQPESLIITGSLIVWIINILIPTFIGFYYVVRLKWTKE